MGDARRRGLLDAQHLESRAGRRQAAGDVLDSRRWILGWFGRDADLRRTTPRAARRCRGRDDQLSSRRARISLQPGADRRRRSAQRQLRYARSGGGARVGARSHQRVRRRPEQRHHLRRVSRRHERRRAARRGRGRGPLPPSDPAVGRQSQRAADRPGRGSLPTLLRRARSEPRRRSQPAQYSRAGHARRAERSRRQSRDGRSDRTLAYGVLAGRRWRLPPDPANRRGPQGPQQRRRPALRDD